MGYPLLPVNYLAALLQHLLALVLDEQHGVLVINELKVFILWHPYDAQHHDDLVGVGIPWKQSRAL